MLFEKDAKLYSYEVRRESGESVAYVNYLGGMPCSCKAVAIWESFIPCCFKFLI